MLVQLIIILSAPGILLQFVFLTQLTVLTWKKVKITIMPPGLTTFALRQHFDELPAWLVRTCHLCGRSIPTREWQCGLLEELMTPSKVMREKIDAKSEAQGFPESRLPSFTDEESAMILGSSDFLGMNFYTAQVDLKHCHQPLYHQIVYPEASDPELVDFYAGCHLFLFTSLDLPETFINRPRRGQLSRRDLVRVRLLLVEGEENLDTIFWNLAWLRFPVQACTLSGDEVWSMHLQSGFM